MPRQRTSAGLTSLIQSDSEPDFDSFDTLGIEGPRDQTQTRTAPRAAGRGRPAVNRVSKPAQRLAPQKRGGVAPVKEISKRDAPESKTSDTTVTDARVKPQRGRPKNPKLGEPAKGVKNGISTQGRRGRPPKDRVDEELVSKAVEQTEASPDPMELDGAEDSSQGVVEFVAGDKSDPVEDSDSEKPSLQRQFDELSKKYDSLLARHTDLRDVAVNEAKRNYERLRKQTEDANNCKSSLFSQELNALTWFSKAAGKLITELKAEVAAQTKLAKNGQSLQRKLDLSETRCDDLESQVKSVTSALVDAKSEIKSLSTKLSSARNIEAMKVPGSALKGGAKNAGHNFDAVKTAQAKEDLYGDLTGLIVRSLQRHGDEDIFDCIQTGRNGSKLHPQTLEQHLTDIFGSAAFQACIRPT